MLQTINWAEGSPDWNEAFNFIKFNNYGPHPNLHTPFGNDGDYSTAAGAYQILYSTWHSAINALGLPDYMSPENQDQVAIYLIDIRGALYDVDNGNIENAIQKLSWEWASLPVVFSEVAYNGDYYEAGEGRYGQGVKSLDSLLDKYYDYLGTEPEQTMMLGGFAGIATIIFAGVVLSRRKHA